jgi:hypothetical protein
MNKPRLLLVAGLIGILSIAAGCQSTNVSPTAQEVPQKVAGKSLANAVRQEKALPPETHPFGDIPDTQAFVQYQSAAGGYSLVVPEGWSRTIKSKNTSFSDKFDGVSVKVAAATAVPTVAGVRSGPGAELAKHGRAVKIGKISAVNLPGGAAVELDFTSNSEPDSITGKQVRLENERFYFYQNQKTAELTLWAPLGADNVDQWKKISESFRWKS